MVPERTAPTAWRLTGGGGVNVRVSFVAARHAHPRLRHTHGAQRDTTVTSAAPLAGIVVAALCLAVSILLAVRPCWLTSMHMEAQAFKMRVRLHLSAACVDAMRRCGVTLPWVRRRSAPSQSSTGAAEPSRRRRVVDQTAFADERARQPQVPSQTPQERRQELEQEAAEQQELQVILDRDRAEAVHVTAERARLMQAEELRAAVEAEKQRVLETEQAELRAAVAAIKRMEAEERALAVAQRRANDSMARKHAVAATKREQQQREAKAAAERDRERERERERAAASRRAAGAQAARKRQAEQEKVSPQARILSLAWRVPLLDG